MAAKAEIALAIVNASLRSFLPGIIELVAERKRLKRMVKTDEDPSPADVAAADADLDAAVDALRLQLLPEADENQKGELGVETTDSVEPDKFP